MRKLITAVTVALLLVAFAGAARAGESDSILLSNFTTSAITKGSPVGTDTGVVDVVALVALSTSTELLTVADGLVSDSAITNTAKRNRWVLHIITKEKNSSPNEDSTRYVYVYGRGAQGQPQKFTLAWTLEVDTIPAEYKYWSEIDSVRTTRREAGDSVGLKAHLPGAVRTGTTLGTWLTKTPVIGLAAEHIPPRQRGYVWTGGKAFGTLKTDALQGSIALPGATTAGTVDDATTLPNGGWVLGRILEPGKAGDLVPIRLDISAVAPDTLQTMLALRNEFTETQVFTESVIAEKTVDVTGKITGGGNLAITGTGSFSGILSPLSVTLPGGGTIANPASPGTTVTITETNIALAGAVSATSMTVGASGTPVTKIVVSGADSLGFIISGDTFWAFSGGVK